jgi:hypothetical protein
MKNNVVRKNYKEKRFEYTVRTPFSFRVPLGEQSKSTTMQFPPFIPVQKMNRPNNMIRGRGMPFATRLMVSQVGHRPNGQGTSNPFIRP